MDGRIAPRPISPPPLPLCLRLCHHHTPPLPPPLPRRRATHLPPHSPLPFYTTTVRYAATIHHTVTLHSRAHTPACLHRASPRAVFCARACTRHLLHRSSFASFASPAAAIAAHHWPATSATRALYLPATRAALTHVSATCFLYRCIRTCLPRTYLPNGLDQQAGASLLKWLPHLPTTTAYPRPPHLTLLPHACYALPTPHHTTTTPAGSHTHPTHHRLTACSLPLPPSTPAATRDPPLHLPTTTCL